MSSNFEDSASDFLELSSEQRLSILQELLLQNTNLSNLTKKIGSTKSHVFRDIQRLVKAGMIEKDVDGKYKLTIYGQSICALNSSLLYVSANKKYFKTHNFGNLPNKFIQRIGSLFESKLVVGYSRTIEVWKKIIANSEEFVYGILIEEPTELLEPILKKASKGIKIQSIFSSSVIIPDESTEIIKKFNLKKLLNENIIQRRTVNELSVIIMLNEKEACISFPNNFMEFDIAKMFYSKSPEFHEWCLDYFRYCWHHSKPFRKEHVFKQEA